MSCQDCIMTLLGRNISAQKLIPVAGVKAHSISWKTPVVTGCVWNNAAPEPEKVKYLCTFWGRASVREKWVTPQG